MGEWWGKTRKKTSKKPHPAQASPDFHRLISLAIHAGVYPFLDFPLFVSDTLVIMCPMQENQIGNVPVKVRWAVLGSIVALFVAAWLFLTVNIPWEDDYY